MYVKKLIRLIRNSQYRRRFPKVIFEGEVKLKNVHFDNLCAVRGAQLNNCSIGTGTYISNLSTLRDCKIGKFCSIGKEVRNGFSRHPSSYWVSTHPAFFSTLKQVGFTFTQVQRFEEVKYWNKKEKIRVNIGSDVWIGDGVYLMDGISIGHGAIIGAGAIVTKDVSPYTIVVGVPAKPVRKRFDEIISKKLLEIEWWNLPLEDIVFLADSFDDIDAFIEKYGDLMLGK